MIPKMNCILEVFLFVIVMMVSAAEHSHEDVGEYGYYNTWRKAVCEKDDEDMLREMETCFELDHKNVREAFEECSKEVHPSSEGKAIPFIKAGCKDPSIFIKFDKCFEDYEANPAFRDQMEVTPEMEVCYDKVLKKFNMGSLREILKDWPFAAI